MSYDGWLQLQVATGGPESVAVMVAELGNCTSNVAPMWRRALEEAGESIRLSDTEGRVAAEVLPLLNRAIAHMADNPDVYRPMNPANGWGDYEGALAYLRNVAELCEQHPKAQLHWWV